MNKAFFNKAVILWALVRKIQFPFIDVIACRPHLTSIYLDKRQQDKVGKFITDVYNRDGTVYGDCNDAQRLKELLMVIFTPDSLEKVRKKEWEHITTIALQNLSRFLA